jgi:hypothetical protein
MSIADQLERDPSLQKRRQQPENNTDTLTLVDDESQEGSFVELLVRKTPDRGQQCAYFT